MTDTDKTAMQRAFVPMERVDAAQALVIATGHTLDQSMLIVAALENSGVHLMKEVDDAQP